MKHPLPPSNHNTNWIALGKLGKPFGIQGGLHVHLDNKSGDTLRFGLKLRLKGHRPEPQDLVVKSASHGKLFFETISSRTQAEQLVGAQIWVLRSDFVAEGPDEIYLADLLGFRVVSVSGEDLGVVRAFSDNAAQTLVEVETKSEAKVLVPFVPPILKEIRMSQSLIVLDPPLGLFD